MIIPKHLVGTPVQEELEALRIRAAQVGLTLQRKRRGTSHGAKIIYSLHAPASPPFDWLLGGVTCKANRGGSRLTWSMEGVEEKTQRSGTYMTLQELFSEIEMYSIYSRLYRAYVERAESPDADAGRATSPRLKKPKIKQKKWINKTARWNRWKKWGDGKRSHQSLRPHFFLWGLSRARRSNRFAYSTSDSTSNAIGLLPKSARRLEKRDKRR